jgi:hypothetical protein
MRDEICSLVKDVGAKQEERAAAMMMLHSSSNIASNASADATILAGNTPASILQKRLSEVEDRPAGTTWVFADESQQGSSTSPPSKIRRSGQHLHGHDLDEEEDCMEHEDDVLAELDEFERQTGGEHYNRNTIVQQQQLDHHPLPDHCPTIPATPPADESETNVGVEDDLDQFMDEFEKNTGGEDFRRNA